MFDKDRPIPNALPTHVIGIGASAGGLEALEQFFQAQGHRSGWAFVVVQHLSPNFKSLMPELLSRRTTMPVIAADHNCLIEANTVYVLSPGLSIEVNHGMISIEPREASQTPHLPINILFESMASLGPRAVGIVLSGTGSDGTIGARRLFSAGGLVLAQTPDSARFDSMPRNAIDAAVVDIIAEPQQMPTHIAEWIEAGSQRGRTPMLSTDDANLEQDAGYERIIRLLRTTYDIDFEQYKPSTIMRRIERRLQNKGRNRLSADEYAERLSNNRSELDQLFSDLLIGVTRFFRDEIVFDVLRQLALGTLINALPADEELRIWVCGCSTGEEVYSIGMLALETFERLGRAPALRILATDLHSTSLQRASVGLYSAEQLQSVPVPLRAKYFVEQPTGLYRVSEVLRHVVIFSVHNVLRDAAFTRIDLVSCRNLLIYLQPAAQKRALAAFHFALRNEGMLLLGESEGPSALQDGFEVVDRDCRLFRKSLSQSLMPEVRAVLTPSVVARRPPLRTGGQQVTHRLNELLMQKFMPSSILVNERHEVVSVYGQAGRFLKVAPGHFRSDLGSMLNRPMRSIIYMALRKVAETRTTACVRSVLYQEENSESTETLDITVMPISDTTLSESFFLVQLAGVPGRDIESAALESTAASGDEAPVVAQTGSTEPSRTESMHIEELEQELQRAREALQYTVEELETTNEELQAGNEELMAANEELQSTNEELQAVNEELYSVNAEHEMKIRELHATTADLNNLIQATELAILFLDSNARLRMFTPAAVQLFPLLPTDIGRDLRDLAHRETDPTLGRDIAQALKDPNPATIECDIQLSDSRSLRRQLMPYRDGAGRPAGLILTYIDVTAQALARQAQFETRSRLIMEVLPQLMWTCTAEGACDYLSPQWVLYTGLPAQAQLGSAWQEQIHPDDRAALQERWQAAVRSGVRIQTRFRVRRHDGIYRWFDTTATALRNEDGSIQRWYGSTTDVDELLQLQAQLQQREEFLHGVADNVSSMVGYWDRSLRNRFANQCLVEWFGRTPQQIEGSTLLELLAPELHPQIQPHIDAVLAGQPQHFPLALHKPDGAVGHMLADFVPHRLGHQIEGFFVTVTDVTSLEQARRTVDELFSATPVPLLVVAPDGRLSRWNEATRQLLRYSDAELATLSVEDLVPPSYRTHHHQLRSQFMAAPSRRQMGAQPAFPLQRGDGSVIEVGIQLAPATAQPQAGVIVSLSDVGDVRHALARAELALQARSDLLALLSTELNTPLAELVELISQIGQVAQPSQALALQRLSDTGERMQELCGDILQLARPEIGNLILTRSGPRLLVVGAEHGYLDLITKLFDSTGGLPPDLAANGTAALEQARATRYDLILLDMQMTDEDSLVTLQQLRALPGGHDRPIIALTADVQPETLAHYRVVGLSGYLGKPVVVDELMRVLRAHFQRPHPHEPMPAQPTTA